MSLPFNIIDLTHTLNAATPSWDGSIGFATQAVLNYADCTTSTKFCVQTISMHAGIGTHLDAPAHCIAGAQTVADLPLNNLCAPCVVINIADRTHEHYSLTVEDIQQHEQQYGVIAEGSFVLVHTGWSARWHDAQAYRNNHLFPSVSVDAAHYLLGKKIVGVGIDTLSVDRPADAFPVHPLLLGAGVYIVENVAHATQLPARGAFTLALPLKIEGGAEAPLRFVGLVLF